MPTDNAAENGCHSVVIKFIDRDGVEMAKKARRDGIATATWWQPSEQYMHNVTATTNETHVIQSELLINELYCIE